MFPGSFTQPQQFVDAWTKMTAEQVARFEQMTAQYEEMQQKAMERAFEAIDESARLMKESLSYATKLSDEWRKITVENGKKAAAATASVTATAASVADASKKAASAAPGKA
ncbi:MAG: hypothetical protein IPM79_32810 [Polyangiaceae bacterium]|nr:hypothetical protein [Polyangiaceae bacterium]MBK8942259.1 hypothetical protein [Polyangiaceae bacterium]